MKLSEIKELMEAFDGMNICRLELEDGAFSIVLSKENGAAEHRAPHRAPAVAAAPVSSVSPAGEERAAVPEAPAGQGAEAVTAPVVGVFYAASKPGAEPFVKVGDHVKRGQTLCIVEAMKMMNEIAATFDGTVTEIVHQDGDLVDFGAPLVYLKRD